MSVPTSPIGNNVNPRIARAALSLKAASCLIDGEAVACDDDGLPVFDRLRYRRDDGRVFLYDSHLFDGSNRATQIKNEGQFISLATLQEPHIWQRSQVNGLPMSV
jgi:hypothetical protein